MDQTLLPERLYGYNQNNLDMIDQRIDELLQNYAKILVVRVDFYIREEYTLDITDRFMIEAWQRLRNNMRFNQLFAHCITSMAKLEYTPARGWHFHTAFIFNGQHHQSEYGLGKAIQAYWENTLAGMVGHGHLTSGQDYSINGTGMVHYRDVEKIFNVKYALAYLAKIDFYQLNKIFTDATGKNIRTFFISQYKPKQGLRGRPRADLAE